MTGVCYALHKDLSVKQVLNPLSKSAGSFGFLGQAGFSSHFTSTNELILGAVGVNHGKGAIIHYEFSNQNLNRMIPSDYDNYLGYSVSSGRFYRNNKIYYVVGAPRADNHGKVYIYDLETSYQSIEPILIFEGDQIGEYFGAAVCAIDVNGDGLSDLLVGAPMFTSNVQDEGLVILYINKDLGRLVKSQNLNGQNMPAARFGTAISSIGDITKDGFKDVAIGAPYENDNSGAIYIYVGSELGLRPIYTQKILGKDLSSGLRGFGISISRGVDIDENKSPDIAVGAYLSSNTVLLRSRPVIQIACNVSLNKVNIDPAIPNQVLRLNIDFKKMWNSDYGILYTVILDALMPFNKRIGFDVMVSKHIQTNTNVMKRSVESSFFDLYIAHGEDFNWLSSAIIQIKYSLVEDSKTDFCKDCPVQDIFQSKMVETQLHFTNQCQGKICLANMSITYEMSRDPPFIFPELKDDFHVNVTVSNNGDSAFNAKALIQFNDSLFIYYGAKYILKNTFVSCKLEKLANTTLSNIICFVGNPLGRNSENKFRLAFKSIPAWTNSKFTEIHFDVITLSNLTKGINRKKILTIPLKQKTDVLMTSFSQPNDIIADVADKNIKFLELNQSYEIWNLGPSSIDNAEMNIFLPFVPFDKINGTENLLQVAQFMILNEGPTFEESTQDYQVYSSDYFKNCRIVDETLKYNFEEWKIQNISESLASREETTILSCHKFECKQCICDLGRINAGTKITLKILLNLNVTLIKHIKGSSKIINITSYAIFNITNQEQLIISGNEHFVHTVTSIYPFISSKEEYPTLVAALSACAGLILLIVVVIILSKYGFFRRKNKEKLQMLKAQVRQSQIS